MQNNGAGTVALSPDSASPLSGGSNSQILMDNSPRLSLRPPVSLRSHVAASVADPIVPIVEVSPILVPLPPDQVHENHDPPLFTTSEPIAAPETTPETQSIIVTATPTPTTTVPLGCCEIRTSILLGCTMAIVTLVGPILALRLVFDNWLDATAAGLTFDLTIYPFALFLYGTHMRRITVPHESWSLAAKQNMYRLFLPYGLLLGAILLTAILHWTLPSNVNLQPSIWLLIVYSAELVATIITLIAFVTQCLPCCNSPCMVQLCAFCNGHAAVYYPRTSTSRYTSLPRSS